MQQYLDLLQDILDNGTDKGDRTGTGTRSVFGRQMRFDISGYKFPLVTTKKTHLKSIIHELLWFIKGTGQVDYLLKHNVSIWNEWIKPETKIYNEGTVAERLSSPAGRKHETEVLAYRDSLYIEEEAPGYEYLPVSGLWRPEDLNERLHAKLDELKVPRKQLVGGDLGPVYGVQWRHWPIKKELQCIDSEQANRYVLASGAGTELQELFDTEFGAGAYVLWLMVSKGTLDSTVREDRLVLDWLESKGYATVVDKTTESIDQLGQVIERLKTHPDCRRLIVTAWNPVEIPEQALPPCHSLFQFWTRELTFTEKVDALFRSGSLRLADQEIHGVTEGDLDKEVYLKMDQLTFLKWYDQQNLPQRGLSCQLYQR